MASPTTEVFFVYDLTTGSPLTGAVGSMSFSTYKDETGSNLSQPSIREIGGGAYGFDPVFASPSHGVVYVVSTGASGNPSHVARYARPEDYYTDTIYTTVRDLQQFQEGRWKIFTTGPEANRMLVYDVDGTTVLKRFTLRDASGNPTATNPYERVPV